MVIDISKYVGAFLMLKDIASIPLFNHKYSYTLLCALILGMYRIHVNI